MICMSCESICKQDEGKFICMTCGSVYEQASLFDGKVIDTVDVKLARRKGGEINMRKIRVTQTNVTQIPTDWLCVRYQKIQKMMKTSDNPKIVEEARIIEQYLYTEDKLELIGKYSDEEDVEQLELDIPVALREQYQPIVEHRLKEYYQRRKRKYWLEAEIDKKREAELPKVTATYGNTTGVLVHGTPYSSTESAVIRTIEKVERMEEELSEIEKMMYPIERSLAQLDPEQLIIVEKKYFVREEPIDHALYTELGMGRQRFYMLKKTALIRLAESLRII
ncbi:ArpU family phage packaging/lysis transcriptional regulator [Paenibacillus woosongensis]|uniref:Transcriptional regulator n=1 Tax=Paenibacillus woosongensis TaxID=307580 RepID=A0ABQ4MYY3_9BACL|nr:ArpU family phage packaging/lysis transcriptional regulator [Paenibacillus woosongensis]GIP61148.1 hypothetical protein J15TS10_49620 [Paenibacillus woosongensis]